MFGIYLKAVPQTSPIIPETVRHQIVKFLEDYAEFGDDLKEIFEGRGKYCPTVLESTVDGSIVKGARRSYGSRNSSSVKTAIQSISSHQDSLISLDKCGLKTEQHKYKCSLCEVTSRSRKDIEEHITAMGTLHSEAVVLVLLGSQARGQNCPICNIRFTRLQLFKHIRSAHRDCFPLRCGYCVFFGQDYYQLRHHIRKKHGTSRYHIIDIPRLLAGEEAIGDEPERKSLACPLCRKSLKTLSNLKKHIAQHSRRKQQCSHCSFVTTFPTQIRSHYRRRHPSQDPHWQTILLDKGGNNFLVEDVTPYLKLITEKYGILQTKEKGKWMRQYRCPHCEYTCNFNSSYNRHLRLHSGVKPYKCGYCDFHAREAYVIKKHCSTAHKGSKPVVEEDKNFKAPYRYGAESREEKVENSRCLDSEKVVNAKKLKKSALPEHQEVKYTPASTSQTNKNSQIKKTCHFEKSQVNKSLCGLNHSLSCINMPLNKENSVSEELRYNSMSDSLVTSPVKHLQVNNAAQGFLIKDIHNVGLAKQDEITHCNPVEDEQSLRNISSIDKYESAFLDHSPVKVRTTKKYKLPNKIDTSRHVPDKQCRKVITDLDGEIQRDGIPSVSTQVSTVIRQEERLNSITLTKPLADLGEKMVVIFLRENRFGNLHIDKIEKIAHNSCPNTDIHDTSHNDIPMGRVSDLQKQKKSFIVQSEVEVADENTRHKKIKWPLAHISKGNSMNQVDDSSENCSFKGMDSREMESNLHSHISYLSDLQVQCHSKHVPPKPGIPKRGRLDGSYTNNDYFSTDKVRLMMQKEGGRVKCRKCGVTTTYRAFYKHARKHFNIKPFKCGYCSYRSIEKSKVRVHNTFCHPGHPPVIQKLSPESARIDCNTSNGCEVDFKRKSRSRRISDIPDQVECKKLYRDDLMNISHSSSNISSLNTKPSPLNSTRQSVFQCPLCSKFLQKHTPSVRRHLYSHFSYKPYKCGYCSYMGIGQSEIRAHHVTHGLSVPPKVETSGAPMPPDLTLHINTIFPLHQGAQPSQKEKGDVGLHDLVHDGTEAGQGSSIWKESSNTVKDISTVHLSSQNDTEESLIFSNNQKNLETYDSATCSLPQAMECETLVSESAYAVQVLENLENATTSNTLPSQLNSESVCVVYLIN
ncbi:uncharacterized protein LOC126980896 isoform X2 [Eriocheir sinensis]|uniref:uncharacterized protein LOC126980896 isoform X2 n=1 Tax=Eriocheir sinensis TaxID=95602 RepID=UPI0021C6E16B|nr:uncharacterized protein LOC126980896 isoform X2 [Eriocheir sinensis]